MDPLYKAVAYKYIIQSAFGWSFSLYEALYAGLGLSQATFTVVG